MADFDTKMPDGLEAEFNKIMGIEDTVGSTRKVDDAYTDDVDTDPFLKTDNEELSTEETNEEVVEETEQTTEDTAEDASDEADDYVTVPDELVIAGRSAGLADKKIVDLFENEPEVLNALANYREQLLTVSRPEVKREQETAQESSIAKPEKIGYLTMDDADLTSMDESTRRAFKTMLDGQNAAIDRLNNANEELFTLRQAQTEREQQSKDDFSRRIDTFFDNAKDDALGSTVALSNTQAQARKEVYNIAAALTNANGIPVESNLDKAIKAYHGIYGNMESRAEDSLRRKLNANKKKFSPRPGGQKRARKFKSDEDRVMTAMEDAARDLGINLG